VGSGEDQAAVGGKFSKPVGDTMAVIAFLAVVSVFGILGYSGYAETSRKAEARALKIVVCTDRLDRQSPGNWA
jgi:hypothetical protein